MVRVLASGRGRTILARPCTLSCRSRIRVVKKHALIGRTMHKRTFAQKSSTRPAHAGGQEIRAAWVSTRFREVVTRHLFAAGELVRCGKLTARGRDHERTRVSRGARPRTTFFKGLPGVQVQVQGGRAHKAFMIKSNKGTVALMAASHDKVFYYFNNWYE